GSRHTCGARAPRASGRLRPNVASAFRRTCAYEGARMKLFWILTPALAMAAATAVAQSRAVTHVDSEKVAAALAGGSRGIVGPLVSAKDYTVSGIKRTKPGEVEIHDHETDIFYVTDGEATLVTGGTIVGAKQTAPGQTRGTDLHGGQTVR